MAHLEYKAGRSNSEAPKKSTSYEQVKYANMEAEAQSQVELANNGLEQHRVHSNKNYANTDSEFDNYRVGKKL